MQKIKSWEQWTHFYFKIIRSGKQPSKKKAAKENWTEPAHLSNIEAVCETIKIVCVWSLRLLLVQFNFPCRWFTLNCRHAQFHKIEADKEKTVPESNLIKTIWNPESFSRWVDLMLLWFKLLWCFTSTGGISTTWGVGDYCQCKKAQMKLYYAKLTHGTDSAPLKYTLKQFHFSRSIQSLRSCWY